MKRITNLHRATGKTVSKIELTISNNGAFIVFSDGTYIFLGAHADKGELVLTSVIKVIDTYDLWMAELISDEEAKIEDVHAEALRDNEIIRKYNDLVKHGGFKA